MKLHGKNKRYQDRLEHLAHCSTDGVTVSISRANVTPQADCAGTVYLPKFLFRRGNEDILCSSWRHELQHARDALDGVLGNEEREVSEARAQSKEMVHSWLTPFRKSLAKAEVSVVRELFSVAHRHYEDALCEATSDVEHDLIISRLNDLRQKFLHEVCV